METVPLARNVAEKAACRVFSLLDQSEFTLIPCQLDAGSIQMADRNTENCAQNNTMVDIADAKSHDAEKCQSATEEACLLLAFDVDLDELLVSKAALPAGSSKLSLLTRYLRAKLRGKDARDNQDAFANITSFVADNQSFSNVSVEKPSETSTWIDCLHFQCTSSQIPSSTSVPTAVAVPVKTNPLSFTVQNKDCERDSKNSSQPEKSAIAQKPDYVLFNVIDSPSSDSSSSKSISASSLNLSIRVIPIVSANFGPLALLLGLPFSSALQLRLFLAVMGWDVGLYGVIKRFPTANIDPTINFDDTRAQNTPSTRPVVLHQAIQLFHRLSENFDFSFETLPQSSSSRYFGRQVEENIEVQENEQLRAPLSIELTTATVEQVCSKTLTNLDMSTTRDVVIVRIRYQSYFSSCSIDTLPSKGLRIEVDREKWETLNSLPLRTCKTICKSSDFRTFFGLDTAVFYTDQGGHGDVDNVGPRESVAYEDYDVEQYPQASSTSKDALPTSSSLSSLSFSLLE